MGPWWFLPFIFQFYFVFPVILVVSSKYGACTLGALSGAGVLVPYLAGNAGVNVYFTIIGHMPELCLGIYLAGRERLRVPHYTVLAIILLFVLGNRYLPFWYLSHLCALILLLLTFNAVKHAILENVRLNNLFAFFGTLSMYLFFVNGFLRWPLFVWARKFDHWAYSLMLCVTFLAIATVSSCGLQLAEQTIRRWYARAGVSHG